MFHIGIMAFVSSVCVLIIGVSRVRHIEGYLQQADAAVPWVRFGFLSAVCALLFCLFGTGKARIAGSLSSFVLLSYWLFLGVTLY